MQTQHTIFLSLLLIFTGLIACAPKSVHTAAHFSGGDIPFHLASATLESEATPNLQAVASFLKSHPDAVLILEGHTDPHGSDEFNLDLGDRRARVVKAYLVGTGIAPERLVTVTYGESQASGALRDFPHDRRVVVRDFSK